MKIAIIGNMNNNGFALMRYFCDLGQDAHLYLYSNDGKGALSHFQPESDTWDIAKWHGRIHALEFSNSPLPLHNAILITIRRLWLLLTRRNGKNSYLGYDSVDDNSVNKLFFAYDRVVCSGIAPAVLVRANIKVDIYYPYSTGVEFLGSIDMEQGGVLRKFYLELTRRKVLRGLRAVRFILNSELSVTAEVLNKHKLKFLPLAIPMVYNREIREVFDLPSWLKSVIDVIKGSDFVVIAPARNQWVRPRNVAEDSWFESKHTDWLIKSFSEFLKLRNSSNPVLCLFEYGPDIVPSKKLISDLGISSKVLWIPKCDRKDILLLNQLANVCVGEFRDQEKIIWGGTGWEALSVGKPLLQSFNFKVDEFESEFGMPAPPILRVSHQESVLEQLLFAFDNPQVMTQMGQEARLWFESYNGISLSRKWLDLLLQPRMS